MIAARERFLHDRADIATDSPNPDSSPSRELMNAATQPKLQQGTPIGPTRVPEHPQIAWMRSLEQSPENQLQGIIQPGQSFTPYFEPYGVSEAATEAELYGWIVKK